MASESPKEKAERALVEGAGHVKFGLGVGVVSAASLALIGTTCPLCFFVAPAMVAAGIHKRHRAKQSLEGLNSSPDLTIHWPSE